MRQAEARAKRRIQELGPETSQEAASAIVRNELDKALAAARDAEDAMWAAVPRDVTTRLDSTRQTYRQILRDQPKAADPEDIPGVLRENLGTLRKPGEEGSGLVGPGGQPLPPGGGGPARLSGGNLGSQESVQELQTLRSRLLREAREERAKDSPNREKLSVISRMQEAILDDLGALEGQVQGEVGQSLRSALNYSRNLNERFTQGSVGKLMGFERRGGEKVAPGLTLKRTVGRGGPEGGEEVDALMRAVEDSPQETRQQVEAFLTEGFRTQAVDEQGALSPSAAKRFLQRNAQVLERFPELRDRLRAAAQAKEQAQQLSDRITRAQSDANSGRLQVFLNAPVDREIDRVLKAKNPGETARAVLAEARRDPTGRAVRGLKSDFLQVLESRATSGKGGLSGTKLNQLISEPRTQRAIRAIYTPEEQRRLKRLTDILVQAESDQPTLDTAAGVLGALAGRSLNTGTIQAPGKVAGFAQRSARKLLGVANETSDERIRQMFADAVQDEKLFRALFTPLRGERREKFVMDQIQGWMGGPATAGTGTSPQGPESTSGQSRQPEEQNPRSPGLRIPESGVRVE